MTGRLLLAFCVLSVAVLSFMLGGAVIVTGLPPSQSVRGAVNTLLGQLIPAPDRDPGSAYNAIFKLWLTPRVAETGVTRIDRAAVEPGYTLYTDLTAEEARLVDIDGRLLHRWSLPLQQVWAPDDDAPAPADYEALRWEKVRVFPDGSLMALVMASNATPYGRGLLRIDRNSRLVWKNLAHIHHDFDIAPDGRIYALAHELSEEVPEGVPVVQAPYLADEVLVLGPDGKTQRRISLTQAIAKSPFKGIFNLLSEHANRDYFHANNLDYVTAELAARHPYAKPGELLLSFRELDLIALLDPESGLITWALRGPWRGQHDPDMLPNGNIVIFDNNGHLGPGGRTRVVEFSPITQQIVWRFAGSVDDPFDVHARGSQERLANGNTLITDSAAARLIEVAPDGRIVWEYYNPNRAGENGATGSIRSGQRIAEAAADFPFNYGKIGAAAVAARPSP